MRRYSIEERRRWNGSRPWDLHLEAHMRQCTNPEALGRWVSSIWRLTAGAAQLAQAHEIAVGHVLGWQAGSRTQLEAVNAANLYGAAARAWARRSAA